MEYGSFLVVDKFFVSEIYVLIFMLKNGFWEKKKLYDIFV